MLRPIAIPGLFVTATDTNVGKTVIAGAIADHFRRRGRRVAVSKPLATGAVHRREGWVSEDAEFLASCADADHPLDVICPVRYAEPLAPAVAADRAGEPVDWDAVQRSLDAMTLGTPTTPPADVIVVEGVGGVMVPLDAKHTVLDLAKWLGLPAVVVARAGLGTINHTLLTVDALRRAGVKVAGVVINRYPADTPPTAEETSPRYIEKFGKVPVLAIVPDEPGLAHPPIPANIAAAIDLVDWESLAAPR
ncbi:MAG TPA: dethiobiotin synthase [Tepidisphaeraceae bacterium]|nr:dethiobiotin synthase [Tepidisphaeraceae bacterium]